MLLASQAAIAMWIALAIEVLGITIREINEAAALLREKRAAGEQPTAADVEPLVREMEERQAAAEALVREANEQEA